MVVLVTGRVVEEGFDSSAKRFRFGIAMSAVYLPGIPERKVPTPTRSLMTCVGENSLSKVTLDKRVC